MRPHTTNVPLETTTMYTQAYKEHPTLAHIVKPKREYVPSDSKMVVESTYMKDFIGDPSQRPDSFKPNYVYKPSANILSDSTNYTDSFQNYGPDQWAWCRPQYIRHKECIENSSNKMETTSVMKSDFSRLQGAQRAQLVRPVEESIASRTKAKFDSNTTYKTEFMNKDIEKIKPCRPQEHSQPTSPFQGKTTFRADYKPHGDVSRVASFKPQMSYRPSKVSFQGRTTSKEAYREWPVQKTVKPDWATPKTISFDEKMYVKSSSYQSDFVKPSNFQPSKLAAPGTKELCLEHTDVAAGQQNKTQYSEQFKAHHMPPRVRCYVPSVYESPVVPLETESCYQASYTGEASPPALICIPPERERGPTKPIQKVTTYTDTFTGKRPVSCPATNITDNEKVAIKNGHHFYSGSSNQTAEQAKEK